MEFKNYIDARMCFQENQKWMKTSHFMELLNAVKTLNKSVVFPQDKIAIGLLIWDIEELIEKPPIKPPPYIPEDKLVIKKKQTIEKVKGITVKVNDFHDGNLLAKAERDLIRQCLERFKGDRMITAQALGICIRTLRNRLGEYRRDGILIEIELGPRKLN